MAKKRKVAVQRTPRRPKAARRKPVTVALRFGHFINGKQYGPGRLTVPYETARVLNEQERRAQENDEIFYGKRAFIIGAGGRSARQVDYDSFDAAYANAAPFGVAGAGRMN